MVSVNLCAAPVRVIAGKSINVNVDFSSDGNSSKCNAVINIPNQEQINFELTPPTFKTSIPIILNSLGIYDITWEGKVKFQGLGTLFGCKGRGLATVNVVAFNNAETKERWKRYFESVGPSYADCIKNELNLRQVKFESGDLTDELIGPTEIDMLPIYSYCKKTKDAEERDRANEYAAQTANRAAKLAADLAEKDRIKQLEKEEEAQNAKRMEAEKAKIAAEKEKAYRESPEGKKKLAEEEAQRLKAKEEELKKYEQEKLVLPKIFLTL